MSKVYKAILTPEQEEHAVSSVGDTVFKALVNLVVHANEVYELEDYAQAELLDAIANVMKQDADGHEYEELHYRSFDFSSPDDAYTIRVEVIEGSEKDLTAEQRSTLNAVIGKYRTSESNPCGVSFYFDEGEDKPYRIADDQACSIFETYEELLIAAGVWRESLVRSNEGEPDLRSVKL